MGRSTYSNLRANTIREAHSIEQRASQSPNDHTLRASAAQKIHERESIRRSESSAQQYVARACGGRAQQASYARQGSLLIKVGERLVEATEVVAAASTVATLGVTAPALLATEGFRQGMVASRTAANATESVLHEQAASEARREQSQASHADER
jgi:hypothetical protein